jgi:hypothetical protein
MRPTFSRKQSVIIILLLQVLLILVNFVILRAQGEEKVFCVAEITGDGEIRYAEFEMDGNKITAIDEGLCESGYCSEHSSKIIPLCDSVPNDIIDDLGYSECLTKATGDTEHTGTTVSRLFCVNPDLTIKFCCPISAFSEDNGDDEDDDSGDIDLECKDKDLETELKAIIEANNGVTTLSSYLKEEKICVLASAKTDTTKPLGCTYNNIELYCECGEDEKDVYDRCKEEVDVDPDVDINKGCSTEDDPAQRAQCENCVNQGGIWTAIGCVDPTPIGLITGLIRIGFGVMSGVALLQAIYVGILYQMGDEGRIQKAKGQLIATLSGIAVLVFSVLILRIIGVNVLNVIPSGLI